jgi:uncharacterized protein (DUF433 family)
VKGEVHMSQQPQDRRLLSPGIVSDPQINGGKAILEGTRVPVKIILVDLSQGMSVQEICEEYDLTEEQVKNALNYAAALVP